jgi:hypothetical protein
VNYCSPFVIEERNLLKQSSQSQLEADWPQPALQVLLTILACPNLAVGEVRADRNEKMRNEK